MNREETWGSRNIQQLYGFFAQFFMETQIPKIVF